MPIFAAADRQVEFDPLGMAESDFDLDGANSVVGLDAAGIHTGSRFLGAVVLSALLAVAAVLGGSPHGSEVQADTEFLISESHFSQSCSWKCNRKFWGKGHVAQSAQDEYLKCCLGCPGSVCKFPCTDACRQKREKDDNECSGTATCMDGVETEHRQCCSRCPGSVCVAKESEEVGEFAPVAFDASADIVKDASAKGVDGADSTLDSSTSADKEDAPATSVEEVVGTSVAVKEDALAEGGESAQGLKDTATSGDVEEGASSEVAEGADGIGEIAAPVDVDDAAAKSTAASVEGAEGIRESAASEGAEGAGDAESSKDDIAKTCGGNAAGAACKFPFEYHGVQYSECTTIDYSQPWCYTTTAGAFGHCNCPAS